MKPRYQIIRPLGEGGMGRVFLAEDRKEGRKVALKFLPEGADPKMAQALKDEVALLSRLSHPSLIALYDYDDGHARIAGAPEGPFFSMEYVEGETLDRAAAAMTPEKLLDLFVALCRGLHYLHARGILHRDIKPENVVVTSVGTPKLLDFGLAGVLKAGRQQPAAGTIAYMAPEARAGLYDTRSDLYSLGVVFQEILKGRPTTPKFLAEIVDRLRAPDPAKRPYSALSLIKFLNRHVERPFDLRAEMETLAVLSKPAWIPRAEEKKINRLLDDWKKSGGTRVVAVTGPTGIGRSRFVDEIRWSLRLEGLSFETVTSETFDAWKGREAPEACVIHLADLHEWPAALLPLLQIEVHRAARRGRP
ncbi:MAG TPA: serine/threonine-protein kinase, partial [bacterium]|nr:serine/threonine-protein kinase [bacterium]